jgi:hypothetical protein
LKIPHTKTMRSAIAALAALAVLATAPALATDGRSTASGSGERHRQIVKDEPTHDRRAGAGHREDGGGGVREQDATASSPRERDPGREAVPDRADAFGLYGPG